MLNFEFFCFKRLNINRIDYVQIDRVSSKVFCILLLDRNLQVVLQIRCSNGGCAQFQPLHHKQTPESGCRKIFTFDFFKLGFYDLTFKVVGGRNSCITLADSDFFRD